MEPKITHVGKDYREIKIMKKDKKYVMIVTEEDERYDSENGKQLDFYSNNPFEGLLSDIVYGDNVDELRKSEEGHSNEGLFYVLYSTSDGKRIGSGSVDFDAIQEEIKTYEGNYGEITVDMIVDLNMELKNMGCCFMYKPIGFVGYNNYRLRLIPASSKYIDSCIINVTNEFIEWLKGWFKKRKVELVFNNTREIVWSKSI